VLDRSADFGAAPTIGRCLCLAHHLIPDRPLRIVAQAGVEVSVLAVAKTSERNRETAQAFSEAGHETVSHRFRWIDYRQAPEEVERAHISAAVASIAAIASERPLGWMTGRPSPKTRRLLVEEGGFLCGREALNDKLPYWVDVADRMHLFIGCLYRSNDICFNVHRGVTTADDFFHFALLYGDGAAHPKLMSIGSHDRLTGRRARAAGLIRFLEHAHRRDRVRLWRGIDVARAPQHPVEPSDRRRTSARSDGNRGRGASPGTPGAIAHYDDRTHHETGHSSDM
jgi:peptidoglycan/xylan/chitin deacetylase (PgdA/CDA1 family)